MKIIIEGFDGSGKSTLIQSLKKYYKLQVHWAGGRPISPAKAIVDMSNQERMTNVIHDRVTVISRQTYEDPKDLVPQELMWIQQSLKRLTKKSIFIYCTAQGVAEHTSNCDSDDHVKHITENKKEIVSRYNNVFLNVPHFKYDFKINTIKDVINYIDENN